jgi:protease-4
MSEERRRSVWFWVLLGGGIFTAFVLVIAGLGYVAVKSMSNDSSGFSNLGGNIAVIDISGVILSADSTIEQLRKFDDDSSVKAIILHIDSPGGAAAPSQEIFHEVIRIREEKRKPVIASIESIGASGAYYIASGADKIYANDASLVGSIGVIMEWTNYGDLLKWAKLKPEVIHAGTLKDAGDPSREMTPEEHVYFQALVDNMYGQFVSDVARGRHVKAEQIKSLATGQVWTGEEAMGLHLIDKEGGFRDALLETAKSVGISGEPSIVRPSVKHHTLFDMLTTDADDLFPNPAQLLEKHPGFYFLWR